MSIDQHIRDLAEQGTVAALEQHLPSILAAFTQPADPDRLYTFEQAAERMSVPVSTIRARVDANELWTIRVGKHTRIPQRAISQFIESERLKAKFRRDQQTADPVGEAALEEEMNLILSPAKRGRSAKKKARRS